MENLESTIIDKNNKKAQHNGLPYDKKPFGEVVVQKKKRNEQLKIKGLQQFDISNKHGAILCANDTVLKVYYGKNLQKEAEIKFENEITCFKINQLDESLIAIGFRNINELHILELVPFIQSHFKNQESLIKFSFDEEFNQIKWNSINNNLIIRNSKTKATNHICLAERKINNLEESDAICFTLNGCIIKCLGQDYKFIKNEKELNDTIDIQIETPKELSRIVHIEEYQDNQWFVIGFTKDGDDDDEEDSEEMQVHLVVLKGDPENMESKSKKESVISLSGNLSELNKYLDFLEFKIVRVSKNIYTLFQSVIPNSETFQVLDNGQKINCEVELEVKQIKGQIRGAGFAKFQIDEDDSFLQIKDGETYYYQFIPPCLMAFDSELTIQKYYFCHHLSKSQESKKQPNDIEYRTICIDEQNQLKEDTDYKPKEKVEQQIDISENLEKQNQVIQENQQKEIPPMQQQSDSQQAEQKQAPNSDQKSEIKQNQQKQKIEDQKIVPIQKIQEEENLIKPDQIQYTKKFVKQLISNFKDYQSKTKKIIYTNQRYAYDHSCDKTVEQLYSYTNLQANYLKKDFDKVFKQQSIHCIDYIYEKDKLLLCTNEPDGLSYIYAFSLQEYTQIHEFIKKLEQGFEKITHSQLKPKEAIQKKKAHVEESTKQIQNEMNKYRIFCSKTQIVQIHVVYSYFLAIVFANGVILKSVDSLLAQIPYNQAPFVAQEQSSLAVRQVIFSQSKKYFLILTTDNQVIVLNTLTQELKFQKSDVMFANFCHDKENLIYILDKKSIQVYDFINKKEEGSYSKVSPQENLKVVHFEEYKPGSFFSVQYQINVLQQECDQCSNLGCDFCKEYNIYVFQSNNISKFQQIQLDMQHSWSTRNLIRDSCFVKCHYNPQIKQLASIFNQKGSILILNIEEDELTNPQYKVPQWALPEQDISGFVYFPYRENSQKDFFYYKPRDDQQKRTYLLPSIMVFSGAFHLTRIFLFDEGKAIATDIEDQKALQILSQSNTLISIEEYTKLINNKIDSFTQHPDYYLLYEKMEQLKHILNFLEDNNVEDIIEAKFQEDLNQIDKQMKLIKQQNEQLIAQENNLRLNNQKEKTLNQQPQAKQQIIQIENKIQQIEDKKVSNIVENQDFNQQLDSQMQKKLNENDEAKKQKNQLLQQLQQNQPTNFNSIQDKAQKILDLFLQTAQDLVESNERFKSQIDNIQINFNQSEKNLNENKENKTGINQIVHFSEKNITIFAYSNQLYLYDKSKSSLIQMSDQSSNSNLKKFTEIQFIQKFPQKNDKRMHLIVALKQEQKLMFQNGAQNGQQNCIFHLIVDDNPSRFKVQRVVHKYGSRLINNISTCYGEDKLLITYSDNFVELLIGQGDNSEFKVIQFWKANFAIFSMIGTIFLGNDNILQEHVYILHESGNHEVFMLKEINLNEKAGVNFVKVVYMYQYNSECFLVVGISHSSFTPIPILSSTFTPVTHQNQLNYQISCSITNISQASIQFKASFSKQMKQLYLSNNFSNSVYVFPISLNQIVHKPQISTLQLPNLKLINGFFQSQQDGESTTYEYFDFSQMRGSKIKFSKNSKSIYYQLDF
ncbi:hypothetical protein TTHERM_00755920 (macronuclear) [Tetrahymena thermophila SB210]|uniref:Uncharacterized protein n=1 Tax=Tetrahymena thermophila (strain SB210) TaxID=312017 RepID=I7MFN0_TETTS|nr:hypothetical protein TTHERM_00755920 [Tetrahymena thermophila SB210]EAR84058.2 hypothetical protein TTHERM_00755920 [Tetrahymena thermophila SB210]|eukprot:XP_001031721.2 hypothetical protein TTHERM_00755920 [Tetrahymena thermophila SB210]